MKKSLLTLSILACMSLQSCVLTNIRVPLDTDLQKTELGDKTGEASFQSILGIVAWGNAGTQAAAENGNITTLMHADQNIFSLFWGAYYKQTTVVYGK